MRIFLNIYGGLLLIFVSILLLGENPVMGDTTLYFLNGKSTGLQLFNNLYNLNPTVMNIIYFIVLTAILVSIKFNKFYLTTSIGNLILSFPVYLVHKDTLFFKPFYSNGIVSFFSVKLWIWYIYLSLMGGILLILYSLVKKLFLKCLIKDN